MNVESNKSGAIELNLMRSFQAKIIWLFLFSLLSVPSAVAQQRCPAGNATIPPGANTTNPSAPFYIDIQGLNLSTTPPIRSPNNPNYPLATVLADGTVPGIDAVGNFIIGATHPADPATVPQPNVAKGSISSFTMASADSVTYKPGVIRDDPRNCLNAAIFSAPTALGDPSNLLLTASHPGAWMRTVTVYLPAHYVGGTPIPFMVVNDGLLTVKMTPLIAVLDNLIGQRRIPPMAAIMIEAGGQDAQGSQRGIEYDTVSGAYAEWVEQEVLPLVERNTGVRLTKDPDGRAAFGGSSGGSAAFTMAWFHPELYHRVLAFSPTLTNQQWPHSTALPGGAWEYHSVWAGPPGPSLNINGFAPPGPSAQPAATSLVLNSPVKPIRFWFEVGDHDAFYPAAPLADGMHDWVLASEHMAKVLAAKSYQYQFVFATNAGHMDAAMMAQTLPEALQWLWKGYSSRRVDNNDQKTKR
jgi:hypothetical protein